MAWREHPLLQFTLEIPNIIRFPLILVRNQSVKLQSHFLANRIISFTEEIHSKKGSLEIGDKGNRSHLGHKVSPGSFKTKVDLKGKINTSWTPIQFVSSEPGELRNCFLIFKLFQVRELKKYQCMWK